MKALLLCLVSACAMSLYSTPVQGQMFREVTLEQLGTGVEDLEISPGDSLTISFLHTSETIQSAWLDDPKRLYLEFDNKEKPQVIYLRPIDYTAIENLPTNGTSTLLTVITSSKGIYQFRIVYGVYAPEYTLVFVVEEIRGMDSEFLVERVEAGLMFARDQGYITEEQELWLRLQSFISLLRQGESREEATRQAGVSPEVVTKLEQLGSSEVGLDSNWKDCKQCRRDKLI